MFQRWRFQIRALGLALLMLGLGCIQFRAISHAAGLRSVSCPGTSPRATVRGYYHAAVRHDATAMQACLTPEYSAFESQTVDPDWVNIATIRSLHLRARPFAPQSLPGDLPQTKPYAASHVVADFVMRYERVIDAPNGKTIRFIYLIRQHRTSPWRIASVGSGP